MITTIGDLGIKVESGSVLSRIRAKDERESIGMKVLMPKAITEGIDVDTLDDIAVDPGMLKENRVKITQLHDVVMKLTTPYEAAVIMDAHQNFVVPSYLAVLRDCNLSVVYPWYLAAVLNSSYIKRYLASVTTGVASSMMKIRDVLSIPIPLPPLEEQEKLGDLYVSFVEKRQAMKRLLVSEEAMVNALIRDAIGREM